MLSLLVDVGDSKELGLIFHKEMVVENPTDVSIESKALCGADKDKINFNQIKTWVVQLKLSEWFLS